MATLYVTEPGSRIEREYRHLLVTRDDETLLRLPLASVNHVVFVGQGVGATTPALHALLAEGITLSLVSRSGELLGRLAPPSGKNLELRRRQYARGGDPAFCLEFARQIVLGKLHNCRVLAMRWGRGRAEGAEALTTSGLEPRDEATPAVAVLADALERAERAPDMATLRGLEGAGSKSYFQVLRACLRAEFPFERRTRRPPRDPANALLSLGYTLLGEAISAALETVGLDPYEGFYHADKYGRPALALDLLEEFRGPVADSVALTLINKRMLAPDDFEAAPQNVRTLERSSVPEASEISRGGVYLKRDALKVYLREFSDRLEATITHLLAGRPVSYRKCLEIQARQVARLIMGEAEAYHPLRVR
jgi:CRISPR-associated protein Cas1